MRKWEYKFCSIIMDNYFNGWLNDLGLRGWELIVLDYQNSKCVFKREIL